MKPLKYQAVDLYLQGSSVSEISQQLWRGVAWVYKVLREADIPLRDSPFDEKYGKRNEQIRAQYQAGSTCAQLAEKYGITRQRIAIIVHDLPKHYGVGKPTKSGAKKLQVDQNKAKRAARREEIIRLYQSGLTQTEIAQRIGTSQAQVSLTLIRANVQRPPREKSPHPKLEQIIQLRSEGLTQMEIADQLGIHQTTVSLQLRNLAKR